MLESLAFTRPKFQLQLLLNFWHLANSHGMCPAEVLARAGRHHMLSRVLEVLVEVLGSSVTLGPVAGFWSGLNDLDLPSVILTAS